MPPIFLLEFLKLLGLFKNPKIPADKDDAIFSFLLFKMLGREVAELATPK